VHPIGLRLEGANYLKSFSALAKRWYTPDNMLHLLPRGFVALRLHSGRAMPQYDPLRLEQWECIERQLRSKLNDAKERYERAKLSLGVDHSDGTQGDTTTEYGHALEQYDEAVKRFTDYVLRGKLPPG